MHRICAGMIQLGNVKLTFPAHFLYTIWFRELHKWCSHIIFLFQWSGLCTFPILRCPSCILRAVHWPWDTHSMNMHCLDNPLLWSHSCIYTCSPSPALWLPVPRYLLYTPFPEPLGSPSLETVPSWSVHGGSRPPSLQQFKPSTYSKAPAQGHVTLWGYLVYPVPEALSQSFDYPEIW